MQHISVDTPEEIQMVKLLSKIQTLEAQKTLLTETVSRKELLNSKIDSSLQPKVGKQFKNLEVEQRKQNILQGTRKKLILLAIDKKEAELKKTIKQFEKMKQNYLSNHENPNKFLAKMDSQIRTLTQKLNTNMKKMICSHNGQQQNFIITFVKRKNQSKKKRKWKNTK